MKKPSKNTSKRKGKHSGEAAPTPKKLRKPKGKPRLRTEETPQFKAAVGVVESAGYHLHKDVKIQIAQPIISKEVKIALAEKLEAAARDLRGGPERSPDMGMTPVVADNPSAPEYAAPRTLTNYQESMGKILQEANGVVDDLEKYLSSLLSPGTPAVVTERAVDPTASATTQFQIDLNGMGAEIVNRIRSLRNRINL